MSGTLDRRVDAWGLQPPGTDRGDRWAMLAVAAMITAPVLGPDGVGPGAPVVEMVFPPSVVTAHGTVQVDTVTARALAKYLEHAATVAEQAAAGTGPAADGDQA